MTRNINALYNTITNDPNAMAHICMAKNNNVRVNFLIAMGNALNLPVSQNEIRTFFTMYNN